MRRWRLCVLILAAAPAIAVACGVRSGTPDEPTGDQTILRVEPFSSRVSCGSRDVSVSIYLDDLEQRPSALDPSVAAGVTAFEFPLRYDPKVLQIGPPESIQPNAALSDVDDDGDGVARIFLPVSNINDGEGWVVLGAASYNPASDGSDGANAEEGLDPVARGGPVLLATVHFQSVGEGTSAVTIEPVTNIPGRPAQGIDLYGPSGIAPVYKPVTVKGTNITVSGGDCSDVAVSTPLPTPLPSSTPYVEPTATPVVWKTVTPEDPSAIGRTDCPQDWAAYSDPQDRFSICYPADFQAAARESALNLDRRVASEQVLVIVSWRASSRYGAGLPSPETCEVYTDIVEGPASSVFVDMAIGGRTAAACFTQGSLQSSLHGTLPLALDASDREGYIEFRVAFAGPNLSQVPDVGKGIIDTLQVRFR
jgi:hypothetical protein